MELRTSEQITEVLNDDRIERERRIESTKRSQGRHNLTPNEHMTFDQWGNIRDNDKIVIPHADDELNDAIMRRTHDEKPVF